MRWAVLVLHAVARYSLDILWTIVKTPTDAAVAML